MLFKFDLSENFDLSRLEKNLNYYISMMPVLGTSELKYLFKLRTCHMRLHITESSNKYHAYLYEANEESSKHIIAIYDSLFLGKTFLKNEMISRILQFLRTTNKFDKLKAFF